ncbi:MAG: phosphatase PAP2 family protein [Chloroflexi bacterium]|nr:phosphatase PAP2 family protein [Chloroflexota bacterium]
MQTLIDFGVSLIIALQQMSAGVVPVMDFFSQLGTEDFFFLVLLLIYWSIDSALGIRVGFILVVSSFVNLVGKLSFAGPRPYWVSSHIQPWWPETSFGVPSGHAQHAMSVWGIIAAYVKRPWVTAICGFLVVMIGFSRMALGAHFPHDVLLGWLLGGILLWLFSRYWDGMAGWLAGMTFRRQIEIAFLAALAMIMVGLTVAGLRSDFQLPDDWSINALRSGIEPDPINRDGVFTSAGTFFGLAIGAAWIHSLGGYQARGPVWKRALTYVIGLVGVLILWQGLGMVFPRGDGVLEYALRFLRYTLVGGWVAGGAPRVFQHFNLTTG